MVCLTPLWPQRCLTRVSHAMLVTFKLCPRADVFKCFHKDPTASLIQKAKLTANVTRRWLLAHYGRNGQAGGEAQKLMLQKTLSSSFMSPAWHFCVTCNTQTHAELPSIMKGTVSGPARWQRWDFFVKKFLLLCDNVLLSKAVLI